MEGNIEELYKRYKEASNSYYNTGEASMSDEEFDELEAYLLENGTDSMKEEIRSSIMTAEGELSKASGMMVSLKKIKFKDNSSITEINKFFATTRGGYKMAPKYDGCAIKIIKDGGLRIFTRGGMDVTKKLAENKCIQRLLPDIPNTCCGEFIIRKSVFNEKYSDEYENARNFVSGFLSLKEKPRDIDLNDFVFIPCTDGTNNIDGEFVIDEGYTHKWVDITRMDFYRMNEYIQKFKSDDFPFLCDGIVIATKTEQRVIKDNYPLNMVAVKFPATNAVSTVIGIEWTQKKSGKLTPVLLIEPTKLDGSTVTRVNGMNYNYLRVNHAGVDSVIQFSKSGDIIPIMNKVIQRSDKILFPNVDYYVEGKNLYAIDSQRSTEYKFYCGLKHLNIEGIGPENANIIGDVCDYDIIKMFDKNLKPDFIGRLGINSSIWSKFSAIYDIKTIYLDDLIYMLQFDGVGVVNAKKVANLLSKQNTEDAKNLPSKVLNNVCRGEGFKKIKDSITLLAKNYGINIIIRSQNTQTLTFEMSGEPPQMTKKDFVEIMKRLYPNSEHTTLCKDTNYLIVDDINSNTGKANKARKYQIKIVTYKDVMSKKVLL